MAMSKPIISVALVCSLVAGFLVFTLTGHRSATLVLEAKSAQNGKGEIVVQGANPSRRKSISFPVEPELGGYVVELPAMPLDSVRIAPLATSGNFAISRIMLSNDAITYSWTNADDCSQECLRGDHVVRTKCDPGHPALKFGDDGSAAISSIPDFGIRRSIDERLALAAGASSGLFLIGICLAVVIRMGAELPRRQLFGSVVAWLLLLSVYLYQFYGICAYSVDVPYSDDWIYFEPGNLGRAFPWHWIFKQELEHRIVLTKILGWLNLRLFSLDYRAQKLFNYVLFGGILLSLAFLKNKLIGKGKFILFPFFLLFVLSPIAWENHRWALQSDYHFAVLFACLSLCYAAPKDISVRSTGLFCIFSGLATYSLAPGTVLASVYLSCSVVYIVARMSQNSDAATLRRLLVTEVMVMGLIFCSWFYGYKSPAEAWPHKYLYPWESGYWNDFLNMVSFSFGFQGLSVFPGFICLIMVILPLGVLLCNSETRWQNVTWSLIAANAGILIVLAVVTMARTDVNFYGAKTSRYAEIGFLMIPFMAIGWWHVLKSQVLRGVVLTALWLCCFISYYDDWSFQAYREAKQYDLQTLECAEDYYHGRGDGSCRGETFPNPQVLDRAKKLGVNFTKQFVLEQTR